MAHSVSNVILTETTQIFLTFHNSLLTVNGKGTKSRKRFSNRNKKFKASSLITIINVSNSKNTF